MKYLRALFPKKCLLCDFISTPESSLCDGCYALSPHCPLSQDNITLFRYEAPISQLIWRLKFHHDLSIADFFADRFIGQIEKFYMPSTLPDLILPVPLHPKRLKIRGFNQALEIAKPIGKYCHIPVDAKSCIRIKNTKAQLSLPASQRKNNVKNAFTLSHTIYAKHVAILDDVVTTGNTVSEIAGLLEKNGVEKVSVWCCARA